MFLTIVFKNAKLKYLVAERKRPFLSILKLDSKINPQKTQCILKIKFNNFSINFFITSFFNSDFQSSIIEVN